MKNQNISFLEKLGLFFKEKKLLQMQNRNGFKKLVLKVFPYYKKKITFAFRN